MRPTHLRNDSGFTLVELLVVVVLLGVVGGVVLSAVVTGLEAQRKTTERLDALHELEVALQRASRDLRAASPLQLSEDKSASQSAGVAFQRDGRDWQVVYEVTEEEGEKHLTQFTTVDGESTERRLVTRIDNTNEAGTVVPVFTYHKADGEIIDCDNTASGDDGIECRLDLILASSVRINLVREVDEGEPVQVSTAVSVRSVRYRSGS